MSISIISFLRFWKPKRLEKRPKYLEEMNAISSATSVLSSPEVDTKPKPNLPENTTTRKWRLKRKDPLVKAIS